MIVSENTKTENERFKQLISKMDLLLNNEAKINEDYYVGRNGCPLEQDVFDAIQECAKGTEFQGTISLVSGASFPDIVANGLYGIEVKSTKENHWTSLGSSILESTRNNDVKRIYLTFGKLGKPVQFITRPYEECLAGISVTHYPRYQIDMRLHQGETIFDKMGVSYENLRTMDNPVEPVSRYYKSKLKPGESLWWASDNLDAAVPPTVRLWNTLSKEMKENFVVKGYVLFPETTKSKYNRYALWLATQQGIVNTNIRDGFSAGGQILMRSHMGVQIPMPAVYGRIEKYRSKIAKTLYEFDEETLRTYWSVKEINENRILQWINIVAESCSGGVVDPVVKDVLMCIFF